MGIQDFIESQRVPVKRIAIGVGVDQRGQPVMASYMANETMKLYVIPGKMSVIEVIKPDGKKTVRETPITQFGWEYDTL